MKPLIIDTPLRNKGRQALQNLRDRKQGKGLRKKGFGGCLQEYTCEQAVKFNFSMDIG